MKVGGASLDDISSNYRIIKNKEKLNLSLNDKVWREMKYDNTVNYNPNNHHHLQKNFSDEYNTHNITETLSDGPYYSTKEEDEYYSMNKFQRFQFKLKEKISNLVSLVFKFSIPVFSYLLYNVFSAYNETKQILI